MMASYSRQVNMETETMEETHGLSPTCEVLAEDNTARTVFVSPALSYRVRCKDKNIWSGV